MEFTTAPRSGHRLTGQTVDRHTGACAAAPHRLWTAWAAISVTALCVGALRGTVPAASACCVASLVPAALIDVRSRRLPDRLVALAAAVLIIGLAVSAAAGTAVPVVGVVVGAALFGGPLLLLHLISPASMGFGDVKTALVLGAAVGVAHWQLALSALALAAGLSACVALVVHARTIPFGPGLVTGATVALTAATVFVPTRDSPTVFDEPAVVRTADEGASR